MQAVWIFLAVCGAIGVFNVVYMVKAKREYRELRKEIKEKDPELWKLLKE